MAQKKKTKKKIEAFKSGLKAESRTTLNLNHPCGWNKLCILHANGNCCIQAIIKGGAQNLEK